MLGQPLPLGDGYYATIVAGDGYVLGGFGQDEDVDTAKEKSIALLVRGPDDFEFLVTSDLTGQPEGAENARLEPILARGLASHGVDLEILRVGNHGAESATEKTFVETSKPDVAIISTSDGKSNDERPHCKTYETLKAAKVGLVLQTEAGKPVCSPSPVTPVVMNGTVRIDVQGSTYTIRGYGKKSPTNDQATNRAVYECSVKGGCSLSTSGKTPLAKAP